MTFVATIPLVTTKTELLAWIGDERTVDTTFAALAEADMLKYAKRATNVFNGITDWIGEKTDDTQANVFPRDGKATPNAIIKACSIYAYLLWSGDTPDARLSQSNIASESTGSASVSYRGKGDALGQFTEEVYSLLAPYRMDPTIGSLERNS